MSGKRHKLSKLDLLRYALDGVKTEMGLFDRSMYDSHDLADAAYLHLVKNRAEIVRRIKLVKIQAKTRR